MLFQNARPRLEILRYEADAVKNQAGEHMCSFTARVDPIGLLCVFATRIHTACLLGGHNCKSERTRCVGDSAAFAGQQLVHGDIKLDNFVLTKCSELSLIDSSNCTHSLQQAFNCDLTGAIYSLSRRLRPADVLRIAALFFCASEIEAALGLIDG